MNASHYSFRSCNRSHQRQFLSEMATSRMAPMVNQPFDPYEPYRLQYEHHFVQTISVDIPDPEKHASYYGSFDLLKQIEDDESVYTVSQSMHDILNRDSKHKPYSHTFYCHKAKNDITSTIPAQCIQYTYRVTRNKYHTELFPVYQSAQKLEYGTDHRLLQYLNQKPYELGQSESLCTQASLMDTIQKLAISDTFDQVDMKLDLLENMEVLKSGHRLRYTGTFTGVFAGKEVPLIGYCQTGHGILPTFYWVTAQGLLVVIIHGVSYLVLKGGEQLERSS